MFKIKNQLLLAFLLASKFIFCQNYQTFNSNTIQYYEYSDHNIESVRFDSIAFRNDSIFYPFGNITWSPDGCYTPYGSSWIGSQVIIQDNGYNIFLNSELDSIKIKTNGKLNESWVAYVSKDSISIFAKVVKHEFETFIGISDSVKTINFSIFDKNMNPVDLAVNNYTIKLAKSYGLIKTLNFNLFPNFESGYFPEKNLTELNLVGINHPSVGINNLTWFDVYDFDTGDEVHTKYVHDMPPMSEQESGYINKTVKTINKYLNRNTYSDSIVYLIDKRQTVIVKYIDSTDVFETHDTVRFAVHKNADFDKLPGEPVFEYDYAYPYQMKNGNRLSKIKPSEFTMIQHDSYDSDDCWREFCCADGIFPSYEYVEGLGGPYYNEGSSWDFSYKSNAYVYYKKGGEVYGNPLMLEVQTLDLQTINILPNPAKNYLKLEVENSTFPLTFQLYTLDGELVVSQTITEKESIINISNLSNAIYPYYMSNNNGFVKSGRIIKN